jgi:TadE-like protein
VTCTGAGVSDGASRGAPTPGSTSSRRRGRERGQATVELALCLPVVAVALLLVVQVGLVAHDQVLVVHAAREAARAAAVGSPSPALDGLDPARADVDIDRSGDGRVRVRVRYRSATDVPIVGPLVPDAVVVAETTMRDERQP